MTPSEIRARFGVGRTFIFRWPSVLLEVGGFSDFLKERFARGSGLFF